MLFHLCDTFQTLSQSLVREAFLMDTVYRVMHIEEVLAYQQRIVRQEGEERHLLLRGGQFWKDCHLFCLILRQLCVHLESTDGVDIVAEKVDTEGILTAKAINVKNAATQGKLSRLVDIVDLRKSQLTKRPYRLVGIHRVALS